MTYFKDFDIIEYDFTVRGELPIIESIVDLMERVHLNITSEDLTKLCDRYLIVGATRPEEIAANLYNDPFLHWTILYVNSISNIYAEWPINDVSLSNFVTKKYGTGHEYDTHHTEKMPERIWMDEQFCSDTYGEDVRNVTNYDYEYELNEVKRQILVIKPEYISQFVRLFKGAMIK